MVTRKRPKLEEIRFISVYLETGGKLSELKLQLLSGISQVVDPWGGSYMMESLTNEIAQLPVALATCMLTESASAPGGRRNGLVTIVAPLMLCEAAVVTSKPVMRSCGKRTR